MTTPTLSLTEVQTLTALRGFILGVLTTAGSEVIRGQDNRVPEPKEGDFVVMTPIMRERLEMNTDIFVQPQGTVSIGSISFANPTKVTVQLDVHGTHSADNVHVLATLFRDDYGYQLLQGSGFDVSPLYMSEPRQSPFINGEQQVEERWSVDAVLQCNPILTLPQQSAISLVVGLIDIDVVYPPGS